jgi:phytoene dehydrogenase-like protein
MDADTEVVIVGAGLAGLAAALELTAAGRACTVLEAADAPGGRVRTDVVDGFQLDRGFQIMLTGYPELQRLFPEGPFAELDLRRFGPGALVQVGGRRVRVADPRRRPDALWDTLRAPVGSLADKVRLLAVVADISRGPAAALLQREDVSTLERLRQAGFSELMIERLWRPLAGGIELDPTLAVSRRRFDIVLRMLAGGDAAVPARGIGAIPDLLAARLPVGTVRFDTPVAALDGTTAVLADGTRVTGRCLVVATDGPTAARLLDLPAPESLAAACCGFAADEAPVDEPYLVLDGDGTGPVRNLVPLSVVAAEYAPAGRALVAAAVPGPDALAADLETGVRRQLRGWFGGVVGSWELLRVDVITHGQPAQLPPFTTAQPIALGDGRFVCGDHRDTASSQGALFSGRRTARAVARSLAGTSSP